MERVDIKVQWLRRAASGWPAVQWAAHVEAPWQSMDFAWLRRGRGAWHLVLCPDGNHFFEAAPYLVERPELAMRHVTRWISARDRWRRLIIDGSDDPRDRHLRLPGQPSCDTYARRVATHPLLTGKASARVVGW